MIAPGERVLVAVSGGKDSLALWDLLLDARLSTPTGSTSGLGIGEYSGAVRALRAGLRGAGEARLVEIDLPAHFGFDIPTGAAAARRAPCSACGLSKRHLFNQAALDGGYDVVATGHNLDDEAAVLFGNVLRWDLAYLGRQYPVLPGRATGSPARSSRSSASESGRWPPTACCGASTTSSRSAPWRRATVTSATRRRSTPSRSPRPGSKAAFYFGLPGESRPVGANRPPRRSGPVCIPAPDAVRRRSASSARFCRLVQRAGGTGRPGQAGL